jgi:hypothetical protein
MGLVVGAGLQGLYLRRLDTNSAPTVELKNAAPCWLRDVESEDTSVAHVVTTSVLWCGVRDSDLHHAHDYGGGGPGYGVDLGNHTTACLIENNVFVHLGQAMLVQVGAVGNVFGYNYSIEPTVPEGEGWSPPDISLHGHYPSLNLFEGNTVQEAAVADYWGACGRANTFFRNRIQSEGLWVGDHWHGQNVLCNELGTGGDVITIAGTVLDTLVHGNLEEGAVGWDPSIEAREFPPSLYRDARPAFVGAAAWPATGSDVAPAGHRIPAEERYLAMP